jgi:SAM-dependent methyltransferase
MQVQPVTAPPAVHMHGGAAPQRSPAGYAINACRVCDATDLEPVVDLGWQPWCNHFLRAHERGTEPRYPLRLAYCRCCATSQLDYTVPKETMFADHTYLSGTTRSLSLHFQQVAEDVWLRFLLGRTRPCVLDIGSNDGTQLKHYQRLGCEVLGVDSSRTAAAIANEAGIPTLRTFFTHELARRLNRRFDAINAAGVFFHLEDLHSVTEGIREALAPDGVFVVQFLYMKKILENVAFDQIYHEHLLYYNLQTIETLLNRHGLALFDGYVSPIHGGSVVGFVSHRGQAAPSPRLEALREAERASGCNELAAYRAFARRIETMKQENLEWFAQKRRLGRRVFGMGAPAKGNTLLNYLGVGPADIECLVEKNELRRGLYAPGTHIPIVLERELTVLPDAYYVLAWNYKREILANHGHLLQRGVEFHFPVQPPEA